MNMYNYRRSQGKERRRGGKKEPKVVLSFEYLDIRQGQTFKEWSENKDLLKLTQMNQTLNALTVGQALAQQHIVQYDKTNKNKWSINNMPRESKWNYPSTVSKKDVPWSKIELGRKLRVIGYLEENVFYVVFLDNRHNFFPSSV